MTLNKNIKKQNKLFLYKNNILYSIVFIFNSLSYQRFMLPYIFICELPIKS